MGHRWPESGRRVRCIILSMPYSVSGRLGLAIVALLVAASVGLSVSAARLERLPGDLPVAEWVQSISIPLFDELMRGVSGVGWWLPAMIITVCMGLVLVVLRRRLDAALLVVLVSASSGVNWVIKQIVASPRPDPELLNVRVEYTTYGFPSGHVLFAIVCFGGLAVLLSEERGKYMAWKRAAQTALAALVIAMAFSRVYLGVHWPSDTLGALVMGSVYLVGLAWCRRRLRGGGGVIESAHSSSSGPVGRRP